MIAEIVLSDDLLDRLMTAFAFAGGAFIGWLGGMMWERDK